MMSVTRTQWDTTQVVVAVDVEKCDSKITMICELEIIFNLYVKGFMSA